MRSRFRPNHATVVAYLALFVALGGTAIAATGGNFILGQPNSADNTTSLTRTGANSAKGLQVTNTSTGTGATALGLNVASGHSPFTVNSATKVANLNADKLDGKDSTNWKVANVIDTAGPLPVQGSYTSSGGKLLIAASGSGFRSSQLSNGPGNIGMSLAVDGTTYALPPAVFTNEQDSHKAFVTDYGVASGLPAGAHTIRLQNIYNASCNTVNETPVSACTTTDNSDYFHVAVTEIP